MKATKNAKPKKRVREIEAESKREHTQPSKSAKQPMAGKAKAPTDEQRMDYQKVNTANKKRRKRSIGRT
jgi:hypothetical protein